MTTPLAEHDAATDEATEVPVDFADAGSAAVGDVGPVALEGDVLRLSAPIRFETDSDVILPDGVAVLREAAAFLRARLDLAHVRVEVRQAPVPESDLYRGACRRCDRAKAVGEALVAFGVAPERISVHWEATDDLVVGEVGPVRIDVVLRVVDCVAHPSCCSQATACMDGGL